MTAIPSTDSVPANDEYAPLPQPSQVPVAEIQLRLMADQMPAVLWTTDTDLRYNFIRGAGLVRLGLRAEDVLGVTVEEVYDQIGRSGRPHPEMEPHYAALAGQSVRVQEPVQGRVFDAYLEPLRDPAGQIVGTIGIALDVTERVKATEVLRAQEERDRQELEARVAERTRELSTLLKISGEIASTMELQPLLRLILDELKLVNESAGAAIGIIEGEDLVILESRGAEEVIGQRLPLESLGAIWDATRQGQIVAIDDVLDGSTLAIDYCAALGPLLDHPAFSYVRSWLAVPLIRHGQVVGMMCQSYNQPKGCTRHHAELASAIAHQAAIAIENARLYTEVQAKAALEERQRLARELHDSVSQALYSIVLGAETAREYLQVDPARAAKPLEYVRALADAGLAEMKALIFELRPESLEKEGLVAALVKQTAALQARHGLEVTTDLHDEPPLALDAKEALYRIAQEALHNVVKHAEASQVEVRLVCNESQVSLEIRDNGLGFEPRGDFPGHLGLKSMCERAWRAGGSLHIESRPGAGSLLCATLPIHST